MRLAVLLLGFDPFSLNGDEERISPRNSQLLEVGPRDDQSYVVSFVNHFDIVHTAHRIPYAIPRYKNCGLLQCKIVEISSRLVNGKVVLIRRKMVSLNLPLSSRNSREIMSLISRLQPEI